MAGRACTRSISWTRSRSTSSWPPRRGMSERFLIPALQGAIEAFPFNVKGFHVDNGSEFVNHKVAALLNRLHVEEFTKSRPRRCNDNALVESRNASVVRRYLGHDHIPRHHAAFVDRFLRDVLAPSSTTTGAATSRRGAGRQGTRAQDLSLREGHHALLQAEVPRRRRAASAARRHLRAARPSGPGHRRPHRRQGSQRGSRRALRQGSDAATPSHERTPPGIPRRNLPMADTTLTPRTSTAASPPLCQRR